MRTFIKSLVVDVVSIVLLLVVSFTVLNYLNIVDISRTFPLLSFLPSAKQNSSNGTVGQSIKITPSVLPFQDASLNKHFTDTSWDTLRKILDSGVERARLDIKFKAVIEEISRISEVGKNGEKVYLWRIKLRINDSTLVRRFEIAENFENLKVTQKVNDVNQMIEISDLKPGDVILFTSIIDIADNDQPLDIAIEKMGITR